MSNDESLIYVLVSWVFHNIHFRHFGGLKIRFLIIRVLVMWFWMLGLEISVKTKSLSL